MDIRACRALLYVPRGDEEACGAPREGHRRLLHRGIGRLLDYAPAWLTTRMVHATRLVHHTIPSYSPIRVCTKVSV